MSAVQSDILLDVGVRLTLEVGRARTELASVLGKLGRTDAALAEAGRALDVLTRLGARSEIARASNVAGGLATPAPARSAATRPASGLTAREIEILRLISSGLSNQAIADRLCISEHTVHRHVANTLSKLDVPSRSAAVAQAARLGLL